MTYLEKNIQYPEGASATGKVFATFIITATGRVTNVSIVKGVEPLLDNEGHTSSKPNA